MTKTEIKSEARYTFSEATGVLLGHEVGAGLLTIPYLASLNNWYDFIWIVIVAGLANILLHMMIAELSLNNGGAQFVECMKHELFGGKDTKLTKYLTWVIFFFLGLSVIVNCTAYITGSATAITGWFGWPSWISQLVYFAFAGFVVFLGMKVVGICEKYFASVLVAVILMFAAIMIFTPSAGGFTLRNGNFTVVLGLYSLISFAMSAVMSVPTVVKGLNGDRKKIRGSIILSELVNISLITILTLICVLGPGAVNLSPDHPASLDLGNYIKSVSSIKWLGQTVQIAGGIFSIFAYSTSLWANTLSLRDMISEQTKINNKISWVLSAVPSLLLSIVLGIVGSTTLSTLSVFAGAIQVLTTTAIVVSFGISRSKAEKLAGFEPSKSLTGPFGNKFFCGLVILSSLIATLGSVLYH